MNTVVFHNTLCIVTKANQNSLGSKNAFYDHTTLQNVLLLFLFLMFLVQRNPPHVIPRQNFLSQ